MAGAPLLTLRSPARARPTPDAEPAPPAQQTRDADGRVRAGRRDDVGTNICTRTRTMGSIAPPRLWQRLAKPPRLSVSQLVGPTWCEFQYHYGLLTHARLPPEQRPPTLDLGHGQTLVLSRHAVRRRARILAAGTQVHESLELAAPQAEAAASAAALLPAAVRETDKYAARCVQTAMACVRLRRSPGVAREVPVVGLVHGIVVRGIIDEIAAVPRSRPCSQAPAPTPAPTSSKKKYIHDPKQTKLTFPTPAIPTERSSAPTPSSPSLSSSSSSSPSPSSYSAPPMGWTFEIRDSKTRRSARPPRDEDQKGARMQCMIYKRLWDGLCLAALGQEAPTTHADNHIPPNSLTPEGGWDPHAEPLTLAALKEVAGVSTRQPAQLSATWCEALEPILQGQENGEAWAKKLIACGKSWHEEALLKREDVKEGRDRHEQVPDLIMRCTPMTAPLSELATSQGSITPPPQEKGQSENSPPESFSTTEESLTSSGASSSSVSTDGPLSLDDVYDAMLTEVRLWIEHARAGALPALPAPGSKPVPGRGERDARDEKEKPSKRARLHRPDSREQASQPPFVWSAIDPTLVLMYRSRERHSKSTESRETSPEPTVDQAAMPPRSESAEEADPPSEGVFGYMLNSLNKTIRQTGMQSYTGQSPNAPHGFVPSDPSLPDPTLLAQVRFPYEATSLAGSLQSMVDLWQHKRFLRGVPPELANRCGYCEFQDGCQWRQGMLRSHWDEVQRRRLNWNSDLLGNLDSLTEKEERGNPDLDGWRHQLLGVPPAPGADEHEHGAIAEEGARGSESTNVFDDTTTTGASAAVTAPRAEPSISLEMDDSVKHRRDWVPLEETLSVWPPPVPTTDDASLWSDAPSPTDSQWGEAEALLRLPKRTNEKMVDDHASDTGNKNEAPSTETPSTEASPVEAPSTEAPSWLIREEGSGEK